MGINLTLSAENITRISITQKLTEMIIRVQLFPEAELVPIKQPRWSLLQKKLTV